MVIISINLFSGNCLGRSYWWAFCISELSSVLSEMSNGGGYHGPTVDKRQETRTTMTASDYEQKRISAMRAMQSRPGTSYRVPNNSWSGYGVSHTSPAGMGSDKSKIGGNRVGIVWCLQVFTILIINFYTGVNK